MPQLGLSERIAHEIELYANMNAHKQIRIGTIGCHANASDKKAHTHKYAHIHADRRAIECRYEEKINKKLLCI